MLGEPIFDGTDTDDIDGGVARKGVLFVVVSSVDDAIDSTSSDSDDARVKCSVVGLIED